MSYFSVVGPKEDKIHLFHFLLQLWIGQSFFHSFQRWWLLRELCFRVCAVRSVDAATSIAAVWCDINLNAKHLLKFFTLVTFLPRNSFDSKEIFSDVLFDSFVNYLYVVVFLSFCCSSVVELRLKALQCALFFFLKHSLSFKEVTRLYIL